jgi:hypothetical protein
MPGRRGVSMTLKKSLIILTALVGISVIVGGQASQQKKLQEAYAYLDKKDFANSLKLFQELHTQVARNDRSFADVALGLSSSLYYTLLDVMKKNDWKATVDLADRFLKVLKDDETFLDPAVLGKKVWAYKDLIVAYFGLGQRDKAKPYQDLLYQAYKEKQLPDGIDRSYNFEKFVYNDLNVWGYESYAELKDQEAGRSFSKHVYYIISRDDEGNDKEQLYTLETVRVHKLKDDLPDYVLTKKTSSEENVKNETYWTFTFNDPVDYEKLHQAILALLKGGVSPDSVSIVRRKKAPVLLE